jgi:hypothetical protein
MLAPMIRIAAILMTPAIVLVAPASLAGDPTVADCIRANEMSISLRSNDHLREAREQLLVCAARSCPCEIRAQCERHLVDVNASIPSIVFEAKSAAGSDLSAVRVSMDGRPLVDRLEGTAIAIDPGSHSFHFESAGLPPLDKSFVLHQGEKERRERIVFASPAAVAGPQEPPATSRPEAPVAPAVRETPPSSWSSLKTVGLVTAGVGVVGIGIGAVFGLMATSDKSNAKCDSNGYCDSGPLHDARNHADASTAGFVAGGVLLATGVALVLVAPSGSKASLQVAPAVAGRSAGVVVGGAF